MTAFTLLACTRKSDSRPILNGIIGLLLLLYLWLPGLAQADATHIRSAEIVRSEGGYVLNADIELSLNARLADALHRGVRLYFSTEIRVERPRWYWFDRVVVQRSIDYRLSYNAITRSYRLSMGSLHQNFEQLEAALRVMQRIRNWQIADQSALEAGVSHDAALRFRLDTSQLPRPFQVTTIGSRDWNINTDWLTWTFLPGVAGQR